MFYSTVFPHSGLLTPLSQHCVLLGSASLPTGRSLLGRDGWAESCVGLCFAAAYGLQELLAMVPGHLLAFSPGHLSALQDIPPLSSLSRQDHLPRPPSVWNHFVSFLQTPLSYPELKASVFSNPNSLCAKAQCVVSLPSPVSISLFIGGLRTSHFFFSPDVTKIYNHPMQTVASK